MLIESSGSYLLLCRSIDVLLQPNKLGLEVLAWVLCREMLLSSKSPWVFQTIGRYYKCRRIPCLFPVCAEVGVGVAIRLRARELLLAGVLIFADPIEELGNLR